MILPKNPRKMYSTMRELLHEKLDIFISTITPEQ